MKPNPILCNFLALAGSSLIAISYTHAADLTWDANALGVGQTDGTGTWLNANQWYDGAVNVNWNNGTPDNAIIGSGGTGGTITLGAVSAGTVLLDNFGGTYTLSGTSLDQTGGISVGSTAGNVTINSVISGAGGITMAGTGTLTLSNASNSYSGQLRIENGNFFRQGSINNNNANGVFGNSALPVILGGSGTTGRLSILNDGALSTNKNFTLATGGTGEIRFGNLGNFAMTNADRPLTLSGQISGSGNFVKLGGAAVVLSGNNVYTGTTTVNEGPLRLSSATALSGGIGATGGTSALTINGNTSAGAVIQLTAASGNFLRGLGTGVDQFQITGGISGFDANGSARQVIVGNDAAYELQWGTPSFNPSALLLGYHQQTSTGAITLQNKIDLNGATRTVLVNTGAAIATLSGDIRTSIGTAGLTKTGGGTLVLSGANTYNGATTISQGTLNISNASTFTNTSEINLAFGARLEVSAANANLTTLVTGGGVPAGSFLRYSSAQTAAGSANGPGTILGTVELNLTNVNPDYTLDFGSGSTFQNLVTATYISPITLSGNASLLSNSAVFTLDSGGITASTAGAKTLTLTGSNAGANTINSVIGDGSGTIAVAKTGGGAWTLAGTNTYSGATTVSAGTLNLSGANGSIGSSAVTVAGGTLTIANTGAANNGNRLSDSAAFTMSGGTLNFNNDASNNAFSESAGTLTLVGGTSTAAIQQAGAGGTSTLTFAGLSRTAGAINFSGPGLGTAADPRSTITFTSAPTLTNGIIGTWATVNGLGYATLDGSNNVVLYNTYADVNRGTGGTKAIADGSTTDVRIIESGAAANITLGSATTTVRSILNSVSGGTAATSTIAIAGGETLRVNSINSVATTAAMNVGNVANTGTLTSATAGGNLLLINSSTAANLANATNNMTINSVIADNTSASSVTKDGVGVVRLVGTNTYSGGTFINAGTLAIRSDANLGAAGTGITFNGSGALSFGNHPAITSATIDLGTRAIAINNNAVAGLYHNWANVTTTISGDITGDGGIVWGRDPVLTFSGGDGYQRALLLGHNNTFTGPLTIGVGNENIGVSSYFRFNSLGNSANPITLNRSAIPFEFNSGAIANLTLDRPIVLGDSATLSNLSSFALTYNGPLLTSGTGARTLTLRGTGTGLSTYGGDIADGAGQQVSVTKQDNGTWVLSGTNTYSGNTQPDGSTLTINGKNALSTASLISFDPNSGSAGNGSGALRLLMDDVGTVTLGNQINMRTAQTSGGVSAQWNVFVGNTSAANGGISGGSNTNSTIVLGKLNYASITDTRAGGYFLNVTGNNGYRLQIGDVDLNNNVGGTGGSLGSGQGFNPTTAPLTITGTVRQVAGTPVTTGANSSRLVLQGTAAGNLISGNVMDAVDFGTNVNAKALTVFKANTTGDWTLSGANSYTGITTIAGGKLEIGGSGTLGNVSPGVGNYAGNISIASTSSGRLVYNSTANQTLGGVISGLGALLVENGTLNLTNAANSYSGATTISNGTLAVTGTGSINSSSGVTINGAGATLLYSSFTNFSAPLTFTNGTVAGTNWNGNLSGLVIGAGRTISPGNSPGTANTVDQTWAGDGTLLWEINDASGGAGSDPGWDLLQGTGTLTITANSGTPFNIDITSLDLMNSAGDADNFSDLLDFSWLIADFVNPVIGFDASAFLLDTSGFSNPFTGTFGIALGDTGMVRGDNSQIYLTYTANFVIPEPSRAILFALGLVALLGRRRR